LCTISSLTWREVVLTFADAEEIVHLLLGHVLANFNIALFASASASRRVA
jgi:hypothetical protein